MTILLTVLFVACSNGSGMLTEPVVPLTRPARLCSSPRSPDECRSVDTVMSWLGQELDILQSVDTPAGTQGAKVLTLASPDQQLVFRAKWRSFATGDWINDPRKELGVFALQRLFLEPGEYVVPPTVARCFGLQQYRKSVDASAQASRAGGLSVCGVLSYWLPNAKDLGAAEEAGILSGRSLLDESLCQRYPSYRRAVGNLNVLSYLARHGDAHQHQFLLTFGPDAVPHPFSVDNSIAFESIKNPMLLFREDWSIIQVQALPKRTVQRLRALEPRQLHSLAVITQFHLKGRYLQPVPAEAAIGDLNSGVRWVGSTLQIGLTRVEIDGVWERLSALLERVDSGAIPLDE